MTIRFKDIKNIFKSNKLDNPNKTPDQSHNKTNKICQRCHIHDAVYLRKFNYVDVPKEYILDYEDLCASLLMHEYGISYYDKKYFINLPKDKILTKYDYHVCKECYQIESSHTEQWNYWIDSSQ